MRLLPSFARPILTNLRRALFFLVPLALLLPMTGTQAPPNQDAPLVEGEWPRAFALPRPTLPGEAAVLEATRTIPAELRVRLHRVKDPAALMGKLLDGSGQAPLYESTQAGRDPFDILREAFLWGGRRAFVTVHATASRALRDTAREMTRLKEPILAGRNPRNGHALPLEGRPELEFLEDIVPTAPEGQPNAIKIPGRKPGLYLVELIADEETAYVPWLVTDLALMAEQDGSKLRVMAVNARDGAPRASVSMKVYENGSMKTVESGTDGAAEVPATPGLRRTVWATQGDAHALLSIEGVASASPRQRVYAFTERPLYRPGQEVNVKAIVRRVEKGENVVQKGVRELAFRVLDPEDTEVLKGKAPLLNAETGTFAATFQLPGAGRLGLYRVIFDGLVAPAAAEFKVEQFVKPAFSVAVSTPKTKVGVGDELEFTIKARYFYGAAVPNAKADWFLYQVRPSLNFWWGDDPGPAPELKESGTIDLNQDGEAVLPGLSAKEEGLWRLVVKVADPSGQRNGGQAQVRCSKGDMVLFLAPDRELVGPGQPFKATVRVLDLDGNEVRGVAVTIKACKIRFTQRGKENGTGYSDPWSWSYQHRPGDVLSQGVGPVATLTFPASGLHLLYAEATDRSGRKVEAIRPITVAAEGTPLPPSRDIKALPDKREYRVGDTARILIRLPRPNLTLHWAVENEELSQRSNRKVPGTSTIVEIPITSAMQPNVWAVFEILAEGNRQMVEVPLRVPKIEKRLDVKVIPDQERYSPGSTMKLAVEVRDYQGRPTAADLSVGVVDEAIYALSAELHPDPFRFFHPTRRHIVVRSGSTEWSFSDLLRRSRPAWALKQTRKGEFKSDDDVVRKNFKDTAVWVPYLATGADGRATTELVLPDNLTAWRATATAVTEDTKVGVGRAIRPSSKPLQVSLTIPRTLTRGEEARAIALVRNLSGKPIQGTVKLEVKNGRLKGSPEGKFDLQDQGEFRFALPLSTDETGQLTVTAHVQGGGLKDGEQQTVEVVEPLVPASMSGAVRLTGGSQTFRIQAPPKAQGNALLVLTPVAGLETLMLPSLPYLVQYPYGCVEQTLSSFVPNVLLADLVKSGLAPTMDWKKLTDLDKNIRDGVFRVYAYQQPNGSWGWYNPGEFEGQANPHTTGFALQSFAIMQRLGYPVDKAVFTRGRAAGVQLFGELAQAADSGRGLRRSTDVAGDAAFMLLSLAIAGEPVEGMLDASADKVLQGKWQGVPALAMLAQAAAETHHSKGRALLAALEKATTGTLGMLHWESGRDHWWDFHSGDVLPTLHALKALCLLQPSSPLIPQGEAFIASMFRGRGWDSTWATSQAVSLVPYLSKARKLQWEGPAIKASIIGGPAFDFQTMKRDPFQRWNYRTEAPGTYPMASPKDLNLTVQGSGTLVWTYGYQVPGSVAPAQAIAFPGVGLELRRNLWRLRTPQQTGNPHGGWTREAWTGTLQQGEEAWMELEFKAAQTSPYGILEVPIPAGLEPTVKLEGFVLDGHPFSDEDSSDRPWSKPRIEVRPDRVSFLFPSVPTWGHMKVRIHLRAAMAGKYILRPAKLSLMSNESQWTTCDSVGLTVIDGTKGGSR